MCWVVKSFAGRCATKAHGKLIIIQPFVYDICMAEQCISTLLQLKCTYLRLVPKNVHTQTNQYTKIKIYVYTRTSVNIMMKVRVFSRKPDQCRKLSESRRNATSSNRKNDSFRFYLPIAWKKNNTISEHFKVQLENYRSKRPVFYLFTQ